MEPETPVLEEVSKRQPSAVHCTIVELFPNVELAIDEGKGVLYATVSAEGRYPSADELLEIVREANVDYWVDEKAIHTEAARRTCDVPLAVAFARDGEVDVFIGDNQKKAYMVLRSAYGGKDLTLDTVVEMLASYGVVAGIDRDLIESALAEGRYSERVLCAQAQEPIPGFDAEIYLNFKTRFDTEPRQIDHDKVDFRELGRFATVSKGDIVARKKPATSGEPGVTVTGKPINSKPGKDIPLIAGRGTHLSYDITQVIADIAGHPTVNGKTFLVEPVWEVPGDVDLSNGNIHFAGSVHISGNVTSGFAVTATENVEIDGFVEGSIIEAGGSIVIRGGVQGRGTAKIKAGGSVAMLFVEHAIVEAGREIAAGEALHADLSAKEKIILNIGRGQACGGTLRAGNRVTVQVLGSELGVQTKVSVGYDPHVKRRLESLKKEKAGLEEYLAKTEGGIAALEGCVQEGSFSSRRSELYSKLLGIKEQLGAQLGELEGELAELESDVDEAVAPEVEVRGAVFPNSTISIKGTSLLIKDEWHHVLLYENEGQIKITPIM